MCFHKTITYGKTRLKKKYFEFQSSSPHYTTIVFSLLYDILHTKQSLLIIEYNALQEI